MLIQTLEAEHTDQVFFRRELCCTEVPALLRLSVQAIIKTVPITSSLLTAIPLGLHKNLAKEAILLKNQRQLKSLMTHWREQTFNLGDIMLACCRVCYKEFNETPKDKAATASNAFLELVNETEPKEMRHLDQSFYEANEKNIELLQSIDEQRRKIATKEPYRITSSIVLRKPTPTDVELTKRALQILNTITKANDNSTIEIAFRKVLFCEDVSSDTKKLFETMSKLNPDLQHFYTNKLNLQERFDEYLDLLSRFKYLLTLDMDNVTGSEKLSTKQCRKLGKVLANAKSLRYLDLARNRIGGNLHHVLADLTEALTLLDISYVGLETKDLLFLTNQNCFISSLQHICLNGNNLSAVNIQVFDYFMEVIKQNIQTLFMRDVKLPAADLIRALDIVTDTNTLRQLDISYNTYSIPELADITSLVARPRSMRSVTLSWPVGIPETCRNDLLEEIQEIIGLVRDGAGEMEINILGHLGTYSSEI